MVLRICSASLLLLGALFVADPLCARLPASHAHGSSGEQVLYRFHGGRGGIEPSGSLIVGANGELYGMTEFGGSFGGPNGYGTVFTLALGTKGASKRVLYDFKGETDGANPQAALLAGPNGVFFGTTSSGGGDPACAEGDCGTVFELIPKGQAYSERVIYRFGQSAQDGIAPVDTLATDSTGALFGTTFVGGPQGIGTVFELTPSGSGFSESILHDFSLGKGDGEYPDAGVIVESSGALYGTTIAGGNGHACGEGCGTVYKFTPSKKGYRETIIYNFQDSPDGAMPYGGLLEDGSGALYGTTSVGGVLSSACPSGCGVVFKLTPSTSGYRESVLYSFTGNPDGSSPQDALTTGANGVLYGTTEYGGSVGGGTIFSLTPSASGYTERVVHSFLPGKDGENPTSSLLAASNGELFGTTPNGGRPSCGSFTDCGVAFALAP